MEPSFAGPPRPSPATTVPVALVLLLVAQVALAGCIGSGPPTDAVPTVSGDGDGVGGADGTDGTGSGGNGTGDDGADGTLAVGEPVERTVYLTTGMELVEEVPAAGEMTMAGSWVTCLSVGCELFDFAGPAVPEAGMVHPDGVTLTLFLRADGPVPPAPDFFNVLSYLGSDRAVPYKNQDVAMDPMLPGETVQVDVAYDGEGQAPLVLSAGDGLRLLLQMLTLHEESGTLQLLVGGETASALTLRWSNLTADPVAEAGPAATETVSGELMWPEFPAGMVVGGEGMTYAEHPVDVAADAAVVSVRLDNVQATVAQPDVDIFLYDGERLVSQSRTPSSDEAIHLAGPALDGLRGGNLTLQVVNFSGVQTTYDVVVEQRPAA